MSTGGISSPAGSGDDAVGNGRGLVGITGMWRTWQTFRVAISVVVMVSGFALGVLWTWPGGFAAAVLALVGLIDAIRLIRSQTDSPLLALSIDITLIGVGIVVVGLQSEGIGAALLYMMAVPLVLLTWRRAVPLIAYAILLAGAAAATTDVVETPVEVSDQVVTAIAYVVFAGPTLVLLGVIAHQLDGLYRHRARRLRWEKALAACGEALLANPEDQAIDTALVALMSAVPAQKIFVDENYDDPVRGLSARVTHETIQTGSEHLVSEEIWVEHEEPTKTVCTELPYADIPTVHAALSAGRIAAIHTEQLDGREREVYEADGRKSCLLYTSDAADDEYNV